MNENLGRNKIMAPNIGSSIIHKPLTPLWGARYNIDTWHCKTFDSHWRLQAIFNRMTRIRTRRLPLIK